MRCVSIKNVIIFLTSVVLVGLNGCSGKTDGAPSDTQLVGSKGELPVAVANATPDIISCAVGTETPTLELNGTKSFDPDGEIVSYSWYIGNNGTDYLIGEGAVLAINDPCSRVGELTGTYTIKLSVEDNDGGIASDSVVITVQSESSTNNPPVATIIAPENNKLVICGDSSPYLAVNTRTVAAEPANLQLIGEGTDPDDDPLTFAWRAWTVDESGSREYFTEWIDSADLKNASIDLTIENEDSFCVDLYQSCNWVKYNDEVGNVCPVTIDLNVSDNKGGSDSSQITVYATMPT